MKRTLVLIRHAKSSWSNPGEADFERPLNDRGERDAPRMGARLKELKIKPDLIVCSPAKRAKQTAKRIADAVDYQKEKILYEESLYHATPEVMEEVIRAVGQEHGTVYLVGHNPGLTELANRLTDTFRTDNMPTCAVVGVQMEAETWSEYQNSNKEVIIYEYPKKPWQ